MADQSTHLDTLVEGQSQTRTAINELLDPMSPAATFGRRAATCGGLTWGFYGGKFTKGDSTVVAVANGTLALPASSTCYIEANANGVVSFNTTGFTNGAIPLYLVTTGASTVTNYDDKRDGSHANMLARGGTSFPYDCGGSYNGKPAANTVLYRYPFPRAVSFPASLTGSQGVCAVAATAQTDFDLRKNGSSFGTMRFATGAFTATFISASGATFAVGDVLTIVAPATPDSALSGLGWAIVGTR